MDDRYEEPRVTDTGWSETPPTREAASELVQRLMECDGEFVSFQTCDMLAINPDYSNEVTPQAVYAFPKDWIVAHAEQHARVRRDLRGTIFASLGFSQRDRVFTFSIGGNVLDTLSYRSYERDQAILRHAIGEEHPEALPIIEAFSRGTKAYALGTEFDARRMIYMTEKVVDTILGLTEREGPYKRHPQKPSLWRRLFLEMGIVALVDKNSTLTGDFPRQAAVFDDRAIMLGATFANPCSARREEARLPSP